MKNNNFFNSAEPALKKVSGLMAISASLLASGELRGRAWKQNIAGDKAVDER